MKILCFGSLNLDRVYAVDHFVTPGETVSSLHLDTFCGGKGLNQSIALARAGAHVYHAGMVGADGGPLVEKLRAEGVEVGNIGVWEGMSGHAVIQVDRHGQNCILLYGGANLEIQAHFIDSVLEQFDPGDLVLLQNEISSLAYLIEAAHARGLRIALNPSPYNEKIAQCCLGLVDCFLLNEVEGRQITGKCLPEEILAQLRKDFPKAAFVLTLGKAGALYDDGTVRAQHGIYQVPVVDTTAAGDTFTGFFLAALERGLAPTEALRLASRASSLAVSVQGASDSIPTLRAVEASSITLME